VATSIKPDEQNEVSSEWRSETPLHPPGGPNFARMIEAMQRVQERLAESGPPDEVVSAIASQLEQMETLLATHPAEEAERIVGTRWDLPGRGQWMVPPVALITANSQKVFGLVTLGSQYHGSGGAVNGGFLPLLFNELMGKLVQTGGRTYARSAFLHVNYRAIARIGVELRLEVAMQREEGRKRFVGGALYDGSTLVADAEALFVAMK
jgi:hypothetical protein